MAWRRDYAVRAVIFDLDGTLVDSAPDILHCMTGTLAHFGLSPASQPDNTCIGPPLADILQHLVPGLAAETAERAIGYFRQLYLDCGFPGSRLYPGVAATLDALRDNAVDCFIATNKPRHLTASLLQTLGIDGFFRGSRCLGDDGASNKQELVQALLQLYAIHPESAVVVGDACSDIVAARMNGLRSIAHLGGYGDRQALLAAAPDAVVETMADVLPWLSCSKEPV